MESIQEYLRRRGKRGNYYVRRRIPSDVLDAYLAWSDRSSSPG